MHLYSSININCNILFILLERQKSKVPSCSAPILGGDFYNKPSMKRAH